MNACTSGEQTPDIDLKFGFQGFYIAPTEEGPVSLPSISSSAYQLHRQRVQST